MAYWRISKLTARPQVRFVLRYAMAVASVGTALGTAMFLRRHNLPHPFTSFSLTAIAFTFWYAGTGPGFLALVLATGAMYEFFITSEIIVGGPSRDSYLIVYGIFSLVVSWFSASRHRAERLLTDARNNLEVRVGERTSDLTRANDKLEGTQAELRSEKDRLNLLLDLNNSIASNLELRDLLRAISGSVRHVMECDAVGINLPDPSTGKIKLYALQFPGAKGFLQEGMFRTPDSLPARVFSTKQPFTFTVGDTGLPISPAEVNLYREEGLRSVCQVPLICRDRVLGVLGLSRTEEIPFSGTDVRFLMQVANQVAIAVENALAYGQIAELKDKLAQEKLYLEDEIRTEMDFEDIVGKSPALRRVLNLVETVAPTDSTVLVCGETGTGKELIARAIHNLSTRRPKTFVKLNCAAIPSGLLESELFGHERGAFTGAVTQRIGRMELANQGTLFLDEVGEIPPELQPKLLRVLQEREFERLGSNRTFRTDVRLIAATNRDLAAMVGDQKFRSDLYFRLNVFPIRIPSLRERPEDIPLLVRHFSEEYSRRMNKRIETVPSETMKSLCRYSWPGNIRELQNVIERAVILSQGSTLNVPVAELSNDVTPPPPAKAADEATSRKRIPARNTLPGVDREQIIRALKDTGGMIGGPNGAASRLGLKRTTLISRMSKLGIDSNGVSDGRETDIHTDIDTSDSSDTSSPSDKTQLQARENN
ncbi:MAG TPA: sigma 54-interacting transcriptional regulator [Candidatus Eremiobacteraceae bacterium]|nr:sigma 54-interacting transcriptional regulator [Candidatus Eremiobacteraceae bacterium]